MLVVYARTGLSPEWDRGFDEAFTDLISGDDELVRTEFDALMAASWPAPPPAPPPPEPPVRSGDGDPPDHGEEGTEPSGPPGPPSDPEARPPPR
jgi:hypothetical protein